MHRQLSTATCTLTAHSTWHTSSYTHHCTFACIPILIVATYTPVHTATAPTPIHNASDSPNFAACSPYIHTNLSARRAHRPRIYARHPQWPGPRLFTYFVAPPYTPFHICLHLFISSMNLPALASLADGDAPVRGRREATCDGRHRYPDRHTGPTIHVPCQTICEPQGGGSYFAPNSVRVISLGTRPRSQLWLALLARPHFDIALQGGSSQLCARGREWCPTKQSEPTPSPLLADIWHCAPATLQHGHVMPARDMSLGCDMDMCAVQVSVCASI